MPEFAEKILNDSDSDNSVSGGLIDSYVAGEWTDTLSESKGLRVGTVFDHQFAYGLVTAGNLATPEFERCVRRELSSLEYWITSRIQEDLHALPVSLSKV